MTKAFSELFVEQHSRMDEEINFERIKEFILRFTPYSDEELRPFLHSLKRRVIPKGNYLMEAGQVCDYVAFINKGHFRTFCVINNTEETYNFYFDGNFFSDYPSFLTRQPSIETHQALEDAEVLTLSYQDMQRIYKAMPVWERFGRLIAEFIIIGIAQRNQSMLFMTPEERYLNLMKTRPKVFANIPQHYIASYLGVQPESLSRIRKRLAESKRI